MSVNTALINQYFPEETVISIDRHREKKATNKYNKPHCIIPVEDMQWVINQAKSIQILWNECWASDQYGSRWMKLKTSLSDKAFRVARKILYSAGLFEFKRETCTDDSRKTAGWLVINLHGARRIKEYWLSEDEPIDGQNLPSISPQESTVNNEPNNSQPAPDNNVNKPNDRQNLPSISSETPVNTSISESLSNISETSQELLKGVSEKKELTIAPERLGSVQATKKFIRQFKSPLAKEKYTKQFTSVMERISKYATGEMRREDFCKNTFLHQYNWRIDDERFTQLLALNSECQCEFFRRFKDAWNEGMSAPRTFDKVIDSVKANASKITETIKRQLECYKRVWEGHDLINGNTANSSL